MNEQRRRRTLFKPTPWAVASWLIFGVAHSLRIDPDMLVVRALKISQLTDGGMPPTYDSMHQERREVFFQPRATRRHPGTPHIPRLSPGRHRRIWLFEHEQESGEAISQTSLYRNRASDKRLD